MKALIDRFLSVAHKWSERMIGKRMTKRVYDSEVEGKSDSDMLHKFAGWKQRL